MTISEQAVKAMPERIYAVKHTEGSNCVVSFDTPSLDYNVEYVRADLVPFLPVQGAVKKLEWTKGVVDIAQPMPGMKYVACSTTPKGSWAWWLDNAPETRGVFTSEAAAKAAAQADYAARILSALEPSAGRAAVLEEERRQAFVEGFEDAIAQADNAINRHDDTSKQEALNSIRALTPDFRALHPVADKPGDDGAQGEGWLPIESAPKDTYVLAWGDNFHWRGVEKAYVHSSYNGHIGVICKHGVAGTPFSGKDAPTHWRPMPALPTPPSSEVA